MTRVSNKTLLAAIGLVAVLLAGTVAEKLAPQLFTPQSVALPPATCDLQSGPCRVPLAEGGSLTFAVTPRPIPVLRPLRLEATIEGVTASSVEVDFAGVDMKMGFNRPQLAALGQGRFSGEATLPICTQDSMAWRATVLVSVRDKVYGAPFEFVTKRN